jgi:hypothetical protein
LRRLRDGEARSRLEVAGAGVGLSRSRHRPPSEWITESAPVPPDGRKVAKAAERELESNVRGRSGPLLAGQRVGGAQVEPLRRRAE